MTVTVHKRKNKFRLVDIDNGKIVKDDQGQPVDQGGFNRREDASREQHRLNKEYCRKSMKYLL